MNSKYIIDMSNQPKGILYTDIKTDKYDVCKMIYLD